ncbi:MAG: DUF4136 domain-containing protein [Acidobacteria bacterium]|nr:DUF4136 domain-containing protein [Acidobacteriota bacterium]
MRSMITPTLALFLFAGSGFAQDIRYNFDQAADFTKYKTYKMVEMRNPQQVDDLLKKQISTALEQELAKKGLTKTEGNSADLFVGYQVAVHTEKQIDTFNDGWGGGPGWRGGWYGGGGLSMSQSTTSTLYVGEIAVDMYEPGKKQLVWRGVASKTIDTKAKPEKREKNLHKAFEKMLKHYPPKKK